ncbi:MAG: GNAT family N-acetyltransferase [bacterium]|nr:GNAT family N-acetyltransferase [bacterium]
MNRVHQLTTHEEWDQAWPVLQSLRVELDREAFLESREDLTSSGYELFGLIAEGRVVSVVGLVIHAHVLRGSDCRLCDLATLEAERSKGFGKELVRFVERYARDRGCRRVHIHTGLHRADAQRFYEEHVGWEKSAVVYKKRL